MTTTGTDFGVIPLRNHCSARFVHLFMDTIAVLAKFSHVNHFVPASANV